MFTLVAGGPQGYKVVQYNAFRYLDLKEGSDGAHLIASVKPFQTACWYSTYLGKGSHLSFLNKSEDGIDKSASNIKRAACFCYPVLLICRTVSPH